MLYPTINQYIDVLSEANNFSRSLGRVDFCTTITGDPIFDSGNFGVVFKMRRGAEIFALKCFTRHQVNRRQAYERLCTQLPRSPYLIDVSWLSEELLVAPYGTDRLAPFDVVQMEFVEGKTLAQMVVEAAAKADRLTLTELSEEFDRMALWLLGQEFAHGDIKPENIMVDDHRQLRLVDYDGVYLPSMQGEAQREIGTDLFAHPLRHRMKFSKSIDDYSIALLCLTLRALAVDPLLYKSKGRDRNELLVHPCDAVGGYSSTLDLIEMAGLVDADLIKCVRSQTPEIEGLVVIIAGRSESVVELSALYPTRGPVGWGFAALNGEIAISQVYEAVQNFEHDLAAVCLNGKWGFVDGRGDIIVPLRYDRVWNFTVVGLALFKLDEKYGFVNAKGRVAIKATFDYAASFCEGVAVAVVGGKYGYIDPKGCWVIAAQYDYARSFRGGKAQVELVGKQFSISR